LLLLLLLLQRQHMALVQTLLADITLHEEVF
jgi:hypothetical protein